MPSKRDPVKSKKVNELMAELVKLQAVGDHDADARIDEIRREIIALLSTSVAPDGGEACSNTRARDFMDGENVTLGRVGDSEARRKKFGKRVYPGGIPEPLPDDRTAYRFSKRMNIQEKNSSVKASIAKEDLESDRADIFSPRNENLRRGLLSMETKGSRFPRIDMSPRQLLEQRPYYDPSSERAGGPTTSGRVTLGIMPATGVFPPAPPVFAAHSQSPRQQPQHQPSKVREVRLHDGYLMEKSPRVIPTVRERIERSYQMGGVPVK